MENVLGYGNTAEIIDLWSVPLTFFHAEVER
jgi:hypothetical protein